MKRTFILILLVFFIAGCEPPGFYENRGILKPTLSPVMMTEQQKTTIEDPQNVVEVRWSINAPLVQNSLQAGSTANVDLTFSPTIVQVTRLGDGRIDHTISSEWKDPAISRMRYCLALDEPCTDPGEMKPFELQASIPLNLDWLGERQVYLMVEFLDRDGQPLAVTDGSDAATLTKGILVMKQLIQTKVDPTIGQEKLPASIQTAAAATRTAFPVTGSVKIEGSPCCKGGSAGSKLNVKVNFIAASTFGKVTEMRLGSLCPFSPAELRWDWEPFTPEKVIETDVPLNWSTFSVNVQYRDEKGNLSEVYCDSLGIEGSPLVPTP